MLTSQCIAHFHPHNISAWVAHVHASSFIPPPPIIPAKHAASPTISSMKDEDECNRMLHLRTDIPKSVRKFINLHLQKTIGQYDTLLLSKQLPHPSTNPLVCHILLAASINDNMFVRIDAQAIPKRPEDLAGVLSRILHQESVLDSASSA
jgi:hypothetical protein